MLHGTPEKILKANKSVSRVNSEMEKRADTADASVLFFPLGCANFLAVYAQTS